MNKVKCPYCNEENEVNQEDGRFCYEDELEEDQCSHCDKFFLVNTHIIFHHEAYEADCLNGADHKWNPMVGFPKEFFVGKRRCSDCGEEEIHDKEAHDKAMQEYKNKSPK